MEKMFYNNKRGTALILTTVMALAVTGILFALVQLSIVTTRADNDAIQKMITFYHAEAGLIRLKKLVTSNTTATYNFMKKWSGKGYLTFQPRTDGYYDFVALDSSDNRQTGSTIYDYFLFGSTPAEQETRIYLKITEVSGQTTNDWQKWFMLESRAWRSGFDIRLATMGSATTSFAKFARFLSTGSLNANSCTAQYDGDLYVGGTLSHTRDSSNKNYNKYFGNVYYGTSWVAPTWNVTTAGGPIFYKGNPTQSTVTNPVADLASSIYTYGKSGNTDLSVSTGQDYKFDYAGDKTTSSLWKLVSEVNGQTGSPTAKDITSSTTGTSVTLSDTAGNITSTYQPMSITVDSDGKSNIDASGNANLINLSITFKVDTTESDIANRQKADIEVTYKTSSSKKIKITKSNVVLKNDSTFWVRGNGQISGFVDRRITVIATQNADCLGSCVAVNSNGEKRYGVSAVTPEDASDPTTTLNPVRNSSGEIVWYDPTNSTVRGQDWASTSWDYLDKGQYKDSTGTSYWIPTTMNGESIYPIVGLVANENIILRAPESNTSATNYQYYAQNPEYHVAFVSVNGEVHSRNDAASTSTYGDPGSSNYWSKTFTVSSTSYNRNNFIVSGSLITKEGCLFGNYYYKSTLAYDKQLQVIGPPKFPYFREPQFGSWCIAKGYRKNTTPAEE